MVVVLRKKSQKKKKKEITTKALQREGREVRFAARAREEEASARET